MRRCAFLLAFIILCTSGCKSIAQKPESVSEIVSSSAAWGENAQETTPDLPTSSPAASAGIDSAEEVPSAAGSHIAPSAQEPTPPEDSAETSEAESGEASTEDDLPIELPQVSEDSSTIEELEAMLQQEISTCSGTWSLYFKRLDTGESISINDQSMVAASLIKLYVAGAYFEAVEEGRISDSYQNDVSNMITVSSNDACNRLIDLVGMDAVNSFAQDHGYDGTELNRRMLDFNGTENYTTTRSCGQVLEEILAGTFVNEYASETLLGYLEAQTRTSKIPAGVPSGVATANKTGELTGVENDVAIVWSPQCTYILCLMSSGSGAGVSNIVGISSMVYNYLNG